MTDSIKDLDALVPTNKQVKLRNRVFLLPGDIPMEIFLRINKAEALEDEDRDREAMEEMVEALTDLFCILVLDKDDYDEIRDAASKALKSLGVRTLTSLLRNIYSEDKPEDKPAQEAGDSNIPQEQDGTPSTST